VGGRIIKMTELKNCFESLGFQSVATILQTGNVVFETDAKLTGLKTIIENSVASEFHFPIKVQVYRLDRLKDIVAHSPFSPDDNHHSYVLFFENSLNKQLMREATGLDDTVDLIQAGDGVIYWRVTIGSTLSSTFAKYLAKAKYKNFNTNRNIKTLRKIIDS